mgnify:CR=1 FL=1
MKRLIKQIDYSLNNEIGGANLQTIFIIGASLAVMMVCHAYKNRVYEWIRRFHTLEEANFQNSE